MQIRSLVVAVGLVLGNLGAAYGGTGTSTLTAQTSVATNCKISTSSVLSNLTVGFGNYNPIGTNLTTDLNQSGTLVIQCVKGTAPVISLNFGTHSSGSPTQRFMFDPTASDTLMYNIYQPPSVAAGTACAYPGTTAWGDGTSSTSTLNTTAAPDKNDRAYNICGTIPKAQNPSIGTNYSDTITITVSF